MSHAPLSIVTCSYGPDLGRCRSLCASVARHVDPAIEHVLIVPSRDVAGFAELAGPRTRVVSVRSVAPIALWQLPGQRRWWLTRCSPPIRGWITQQLTKLAAFAAVESDAVLFADSDVVFVRPFDAGRVYVGDRLRVQRLPGPPPASMHVKWYHAACRLLGVEATDWLGADYIGQLVTWRRDVVEGLQRRLAEVAGASGRGGWARALANTLHFSEYLLYGVYVERVLGLEASGLAPAADELCHCSWHYENSVTRGALDVDAFLADLRDEHAAVLLQSNLDIDPGWHDRLARETLPAATPTRPAAVGLGGSAA